MALISSFSTVVYQHEIVYWGAFNIRVIGGVGDLTLAESITHDSEEGNLGIPNQYKEKNNSVGKN